MAYFSEHQYCWWYLHNWVYKRNSYKLTLLKLSQLENWFFFLLEKIRVLFSPQNKTLTFWMLQSYSCWATCQQNPLAWALGEDFTLAWGDGARRWESPCQDDTSSGVSPQETRHRTTFNSCSPSAAECNTSFFQNSQQNYKHVSIWKNPFLQSLTKEIIPTKLNK